MNEYILLIAIVAIPGVTYLLMRRTGIAHTPEGKFWMALSAGLALVLLTVAYPQWHIQGKDQYVLQYC